MLQVVVKQKMILPQTINGIKLLRINPIRGNIIERSLNLNAQNFFPENAVFRVPQYFLSK